MEIFGSFANLVEGAGMLRKFVYLKKRPVQQISAAYSLIIVVHLSKFFICPISSWLQTPNAAFNWSSERRIFPSRVPCGVVFFQPSRNFWFFIEVITIHTDVLLNMRVSLFEIFTTNVLSLGICQHGTSVPESLWFVAIRVLFCSKINNTSQSCQTKKRPTEVERQKSQTIQMRRKKNSSNKVYT